MKQINITVAIAFISLVLFSGCKKSSTNYSAVKPLPTAGIIYELITHPQNPNSFLLWDDGYVTTSIISFNGTNVVGNALHMVQYQESVPQTVKLFNRVTLGTVNVPSKKFDFVSFSATLTPATQEYALFLSGVCNMNDEKIPVQIIIDQNVTFNSDWLSNVTITYFTSQIYKVNLSLDLSLLTNGINANTLSTAVITNGMILISANSNQNLYQVILNNLQNSMKFQFEKLFLIKQTPQPVSVPSPIS